MIIVLIFMSILFLGNIAQGYIVWKGAKRLLQFDDLVELLSYDVDTNLEYIAKVNNTPLLMNTPEVMEMSNNFKIIQQRMEEYRIRMEETTGRPRPTKKVG